MKGDHVEGAGVPFAYEGMNHTHSVSYLAPTTQQEITLIMVTQQDTGDESQQEQMTQGSQFPLLELQPPVKVNDWRGRSSASLIHHNKYVIRPMFVCILS